MTQKSRKRVVGRGGNNGRRLAFLDLRLEMMEVRRWLGCSTEVRELELPCSIYLIQSLNGH